MEEFKHFMSTSTSEQSARCFVFPVFVVLSFFLCVLFIFFLCCFCSQILCFCRVFEARTVLFALEICFCVLDLVVCSKMQLLWYHLDMSQLQLIQDLGRPIWSSRAFPSWFCFFR